MITYPRERLAPVTEVHTHMFSRREYNGREEVFWNRAAPVRDGWVLGEGLMERLLAEDSVIEVGEACKYRGA